MSEQENKEIVNTTSKIVESLSELLKTLEANPNALDSIELNAAIKSYIAEIEAELDLKEHMSNGYETIKYERELADKYLSDEAKAHLSKKTKSLNLKDKDGNITHQCIYYSVQVPSDKIEKGVKAICDTVNQLASLNAIHSFLAIPSSLELARTQLNVETSAVFAFVLVDVNHVNEAKKLPYHILEGDAGEVLPGESIKMEDYLEDGEFLVAFNISWPDTTLDIWDQASNSVVKMLAILPEGTKSLDIIQNAVTDMSSPFTAVFYNPKLLNLKRVKFEYLRQATLTSPGNISQFNVLKKVRYFGLDDREIYTNHH